ncbi:hypothetical protein IKF12_03040 [Candidatus Saccharibacteria bacterium]|nr:hypothetical protein [Candidatus Saccharibacteria bacterium]
MKRSYCLLALLCSIFIGSLITVGVSSALEYQTGPSSGDNPATLKFEFGSTLNITTGGNISISDLTPGTKAISDSNYNVTVSTNNLTGYTLSATVGCSSGTDCYDSKNLSDGTNNFSMLSTDGALTAGTWGVSLDSSATANSNFKTLAKYDETATIINQTTNNTGTPATGYTGTANTTVRLGAYATASQVAGTYTNSINFIAVANAMPEFMQDMTAARLATLMPNEGDTAILYDKRDGEGYLIGCLADSRYWMLDNLRLDLTTVTLSTLQGKTNATDAELVYLKNGGGSVSDQYAVAGVSSNWGNSNSFSAPLIKTNYKNDTSTSYGLGSGKNGIYYNYCAASAGTYCFGDGEERGTSTGNASSDICPSGWRLPSGYNGDFSSFLATYSDFDSSNNDSIQYNLSLTLAGVYYTGSVTGRNTAGYYWSSNRSDDNAMGFLYATDSNAYYYWYARRNGLSVRCLFNI